MKWNYFTWLPAVIIMVLIFSFSHKPANRSNESSLTIANKVLTIYETVTDNQYDTVQRLDQLEKINHYVRKGAHFSEYALLAIAFALHFLTCKWNKLKYFSFSAMFSALYAISDEYHQTFIEGRSGQFSDVLIDASGAVTGTLLFVLLITILERIHKKIIAK